MAGRVDLLLSDSMALQGVFLDTSNGEGAEFVSPNFTGPRWFGEPRCAAGLRCSAMDLPIIWESLPRRPDGAALTLEITVINGLIGLALAVPLAIMRLSSNPLIWMPVYGYILYFRGTPLLVQLFPICYGSGQFWPFLDLIRLWGCCTKRLSAPCSR